MNPLFDFFARLSATARSTIDEAIGQGLDTQNKGGLDEKGGSLYDPVTAVDRGVERALRAMIEAEFPADGIIGEEYGAVREGARRVWSLDPIDGTRQLVCGLPTWTVLVGLVEDGVPVAGIIDTPRLDELVIGDASGTVLHGTSQRLRTSGCTDLAEARLSTTDPYLFDADAAPRFERLRQGAMLTRFLCADCPRHDRSRRRDGVEAARLAGAGPGGARCGRGDRQLARRRRHERRRCAGGGHARTVRRGGEGARRLGVAFLQFGDDVGPDKAAGFQ
jgi:fructose-1,6-bisphosphatase/inositol monophosphatase family enzyme